MAELSGKIISELANIDQIFNEIPSHEKLPYLSVLELAGVAALLHNFYNGIENILKQILIAGKIQIPEGRSWHKELLIKSVENEVITENCKNLLVEYLAFRHFFSHAYAFDLYADKMEPLVENLKTVYTEFKKNINKFV